MRHKDSFLENNKYLYIRESYLYIKQIYALCYGAYTK